MASSEMQASADNTGILLFPSNSFSLQIAAKLTGLSEEEFSRNCSAPVHWQVDTKYYTCDVPIVHSSDLKKVKTWSSCRDALVAVLDQNNELNCWSMINSQIDVFNNSDIGVKMMIVNYSTVDKTDTQKEIEGWCSENDFELINLTDTPEDEYDVVGVERVRQTLLAYTWSNLVMKEKPSVRSEYMKNLYTECNTEQTANGDHAENNETNSTNNGSELSEELLTSALSDPGEDGVESFEKLFSELRVMKEQSENMSPESRKKFAENVALSFYTALGGSDTDDD